MKRSEMVNVIYDILDRYLDGNARSSQALYVLKTIEDLGMLPPIVSIPNRCMCSMRSSCQDCSPHLYKTKWEEE